MHAELVLNVFIGKEWCNSRGQCHPYRNRKWWWSLDSEAGFSGCDTLAYSNGLAKKSGITGMLNGKRYCRLDMSFLPVAGCINRGTWLGEHAPMPRLHTIYSDPSTVDGHIRIFREIWKYFESISPSLDDYVKKTMFCREIKNFYEQVQGVF